MTDFLLELRSEEIPARMQIKAKDDLARLFADEIARAGLTATTIETFATPRRLALIARGLPEATAAVSEERKGPRSNAPEQALAGFLRSTGLTREQLVERDGVFFAVIDKPGRPTAEVLAEAVPAVVRAFPWPKSMRWGDASLSTESLRWVRPLQGIVALFGDDVVPFEVDGIESGAATMGHRFHHSGPITIGSASDYVEKLRACHVIVHLSERTTLIRDGARAAAAAEGLVLVEDEGLVVENAGLTEWPVPLLGRFDPEFLDVPREVIQLTMRTNQKYFACTDSTGALANAFVCTANIDASDGGAAIVAGNRKVLAARLSDAKFFWENDLKVSLDEHAAKLKGTVFHESSGTIADKTKRVAIVAGWLASQRIVIGAEQVKTERAASLMKADLVTGMVGEFPELQGIIGSYYAADQGENPEVVAAIRDQYNPIGQKDETPTAAVTVAVGIADRIDNLVSLPRPNGSRDPFALRRSALGFIELIVKNDIRVKLRDLICAASSLSFSQRQLFNGQMLISYSQARQSVEGVDRYRAQFRSDPPMSGASREQLDLQRRLVESANYLFSFVIDRLKVQQREAGVRHDLIDAVFALGQETGTSEDDLVCLLARVKALQAFVGTAEGANLLAGYKRAANILKKEGAVDTQPRRPGPRAGVPLSAEVGTQGSGTPDQVRGDEREAAKHIALSYTPEPCEADLIAALAEAAPRVGAAIEAEDFEGAMIALSSLRAPIDAFFENVTVNDADTDKRAARLALLARFRDAVHRVADFSKIEG